MAQAEELQKLLASVMHLGDGEGFPLDQVPPIENDAERSAYAAFADKIYAELEGRYATPGAKAGSPKGQLASAIWARVTEWDERGDDQ